MAQQPRDAVQTGHAMRRGKRVSPAGNFAARLFGYDLFISFALGPPPRGSHSYASDLARRLRERDFTVFFSEDEAPPGEQLDGTLRNALRRSKNLVVIANRGTLEEPRWVRKEVEEFRRLQPPRPVIPISIGGALQDPTLAQRTRDWLDFQDRIWLDESEESAGAGIASARLVERLALAPTRVRSNVWWRWLIRVVVTALVALAVALAFAAKVARDQREVAERRLYDSNMNLAHQAQMAGNPARANELLKEYLPSSGNRDLRSFPWYHLWHAGHNELTTFEGHEESVTCVAFSPDGRTLASGSADASVKLWDVANRKALGAPPLRHSATVLSVAFAPDRQVLASADENGTVILWRPSASGSWEQVGHTLEGYLIAFSPDGKALASANADGTLKLWETGTWKQLATSTPADRSPAVTSIAFSPDNSTLASGSADGTVRLWDAFTWQPLTPPRRTASGRVNSVAFSPDGKSLAATSDNTVRLFDVADRDGFRELAKLAGHSNLVHSVVFSPDGRTLASASEDQTVKLWDTGTQQELATLRGHERWLLAVAFSPDGKTLASAGWDQTVKLWDASTRPELTALTSRARSIAFAAPDGRTLASANYDGTVQLWDVANRKALGAPLPGRSAPVSSVVFSPDGKTLAVAREDQSVKLWNVGQPNEPEAVAALDGPSGPVRSVAFAPDGKALAATGTNGTLKLWDVGNPEEPREMRTIRGHAGPISAVAFSPDGKTFASASEDQAVKLWDTTTWQELATLTLTEHSGYVYSVAFSPDGGTLAAAGPNNTVKLWEVTNRKAPRALATLTGHSRYVRSVAFSPDGQTLASGSDDMTVRLWDTSTWQEMATLQGHSDSVHSVAFSRAGKTFASTSVDLTLASASDDGTVRLWTAATEGKVASQRNQGSN
jgi:WD40 repeat protein